ncbi:MAG: YggS family pyridoxal phosphate-dependent enzyme [Geminicoccaceae bacterium]
MQPADSPVEPDDAAGVAGRLAAVRADLAEAARAAGRDAASIELVAVSKRQSDARIDGALVAGQRVFGENYVQEAAGRWAPRRAAYADLVLHLIGGLQTNKARDAVALFDVIQTLDRPKLAQALAKAMADQARRPACYIQVNTGEESQKSGILPADLDAFVALCRDELGLPVKGLMCIPPVDDEPGLHFALLAKLAARNRLDGLSMGMSDDYGTAVRLGATCVRVGTAIFGKRL